MLCLINSVQVTRGCALVIRRMWQACTTTPSSLPITCKPAARTKQSRKEKTMTFALSSMSLFQMILIIVVNLLNQAAAGECDSSVQNCKPDGCDGFNSRDCDDCVSRYYEFGYSCRTCLSNCAACTSGSTCSECDPGFFGDECKPCGAQCVGTCTMNGCAQCASGFFGPACEREYQILRRFQQF